MSIALFLEHVHILLITFINELVFMDEAQSGGIDAVAEAAGLFRAIIEDVAKVGVGFG
jgi:UDP-glucose 6-dehydrogenase